MIDTVTIGKIIKKLRCDKNLTQEELAEKINISKNYLSKVERGLSKLNIETFLNMAEVLGFTLEDFGVRVQPQPIMDESKEKLVKMVLAGSPKETRVYLKTLNFIEELLQTK